MTTRHRLQASLAACAIMFLAAGCANTSASEQPSTAASNSEELHATVLEQQIADTQPSDAAVTVDVGNGHTVQFDQGEKVKVAFVGFGKGYDYTVPEYEAAEAEAKALGFDVTTFDPQADPQTQLSQIQTVMNSGQYNALVVYPLAPDLLCDVLSDQAPSKGLLVVAIGYPACIAGQGTPGLLTSIPDTMPGTEVATAWANGIIKVADGKPQKAIVLRGPDYDPNSNMAEEVFQELLPPAGIEILDSLETDFTQPGALQVIQDGLQRHQDATMIISTFPEGGSAAATALEQANKQDSITLIGYGADSHNQGALDDGVMKLSVPFYPYTNVKAAYEAIELARRGQPVEDFYPYAGHRPEAMRAPGDQILLVTPDNVAEYAATVQEY